MYHGITGCLCIMEVTNWYERIVEDIDLSRCIMDVTVSVSLYVIM